LLTGVLVDMYDPFEAAERRRRLGSVSVWAPAIEAAGIANPGHFRDVVKTYRMSILGGKSSSAASAVAVSGTSRRDRCVFKRARVRSQVRPSDPLSGADLP
jgi:hypothetical protein